MNLEKQQDVFDTIKATDNKGLWSLAGLIAKGVFNANKATKKLQKELDKQTALPLDTGEVTDDELRRDLRLLLRAKLKDQSLSAAEIAQLKDIFGLTNAKQDVSIEIVSYKDVGEEAN